MCVCTRAISLLSQEVATLEDDAIGTVTYTYDVAQQNEYVQMQYIEVTSAVMHDLIFNCRREEAPPPPLPTSSPLGLHRNPAYQQITPNHATPNGPSSHQPEPEYETVRL